MRCGQIVSAMSQSFSFSSARARTLRFRMPQRIMSVEQRAAQLWPLLAYAAMRHQLLTYGEVGKLIGVAARGLGRLLEPLQSYCLLQKFPPLTAIVVRR